MKKSLAIFLLSLLMVASCRRSGDGAAGESAKFVFRKYADGRPNASLRMPAHDAGVV